MYGRRALRVTCHDDSVGARDSPREFARVNVFRSRAALALTALLTVAKPVGAQSTGGLFLLAPFGARAVGQGEAVVADTSLGTEGIWWNAAALARLTKRELAIHYSTSVIANSTMIAFAMPSRVLGTLAAAYYLVDYGDQPATPASGGEISTGTISNKNHLLALSYATPVGSRLSAGLSYKLILLRFNQCSGLCGNSPGVTGSTQALDVGAQYRVPASVPFTVGLSVRNLGPALQAKDKDQADPLPRIVQAGAKVRLPMESLKSSGATLDLSADVVKSTALDGQSASIGAVLGYREQLFLRGGYKVQAGGIGGPSLGLALERGNFGFDVARRFGGLGDLGDPPTYISLHAKF